MLGSHLPSSRLDAAPHKPLRLPDYPGVSMDSSDEFGGCERRILGAIDRWHPGSIVESMRLACPQVPAMLILQVDPERFRFSVYHFRDEGLHIPPPFTGGSNAPMPTWSSMRDCFARTIPTWDCSSKKDVHSAARSIIHGKGCSQQNQPTISSGKPGYWISHLKDSQKSPPAIGRPRSH